MPFAGVYTAFTNGGFFIDGQARWDFYQNELSDVANGLFAQEFNGRGYSLSGNIGYNVRLQNGSFVEPSAGVVWSKVRLRPS